jgi:hypothetical protein
MDPLPQLDPNERGNAHLQRLVRCLHPHDHAAFVEKLTTQPLRERFHTYRELLLGAQLRLGGADFRYEQDIDGQTPDWSLSDSGRLIEVVDVVTFHQRKDKEREITTDLRSTDRWTGWITIPPDHSYRKLSDKAGQYAALARRTQVPYVLAAFGDFLASLDPEDLKHVLYTQHGGWFATTKEVSGVIYFHEKNARFEFVYFANPKALHHPRPWSSRISRWSEA